jgi:Carboxypeptidase regulatory-like domain
MMRPVSALLCCFAFTVAVFAQNDRGTITGEVWDQGNAVVPNAIVVAKNADNGTESKTVTSGTGNYTIPSLPAGRYSLVVEVPGFKKYVQENIEVQVAQIDRIDVRLQVGTASETVTVTAEAAILKTESAEQSTVIQTERINALPLNFGGGGGSSGNIRSPFAFNMLSPGVTGTGQDTSAVNGLPTGTFRVQVEGQDATSQNDPNWTSTVSHSSVDAIQEFSLQTSTFSAEFSQVGGGFYNFTTKSGTNQLHGAAYEYMTNEDLNAQRPYFTPTVPQTNPRSRKHDFGGTIGGPVYIPKVYNGKNKTFFFFSEEVFRNVTYANGSSFLTLPTAAMRTGDFSSTTLFPGQNIGTDPAGKPILNGAIYDPASRTTLANGQVVATMFPGNVIPQNRFDPVAVKIQNLIPLPTNANPTSNYAQLFPTPNNQQTPTIKIDQILPDNSRLSFYFNKLTTNQLTSNDSLPQPVSAVRVQAIYGTIPRLNYDKPITPTLLLHAGVGYQRFHNPDSSPAGSLQYDAVSGIGFTGSSTTPSGFPRLNGLTTSFGPSNANSYFDGTFTSVASASWSHGSHNYKLGGEYRLNSWTDRNSRGAQGILNFSGNETGNPFNNTGSFSANGVSGSVGNSYASFLLGQIDTASVNTVQDPQLRKSAWGLYITDTWKVTPKLTLEYGLRWDIENWGHEIHHRWVEFGPNTPNPTVNNIPGALIYEGNGPGRCNCLFTKAYPYAIGPRLGGAYQINSKTVLRGGAGINYAPIPSFNYITNAALLGVGFNQLTFNNPGGAFGVPAATLSKGLVYDPTLLTAASLNPGLFPASPTVLGNPNFYQDPNSGRPARILAWSIGLQREVTKDLIVEANYVGNRGAWENNSAPLGGLNTPNPASFARFGIDPTTAAGQATLVSTLGSALGKASGVPLPYPTFPTTATVLQALRPYPQVNGTVTVNGAPLGDSWYNSLQVKVNKRYSHGLSLTSAFTYSKTEANPAGTINNIFNRANQKGITANDIPLIFNTGFSYEAPKFRWIANKYLKNAASGWVFGGLLLFQSGAPIAVPTSSNNQSGWYGQSTLENRVSGQPLFLTNLNCHCINPTSQFVLNPAAWANPALGQFGVASPFYGDYRSQRRPMESINVGRTFRVGERKSLEVRAEFFNVLNRMELNGPSSGSPQGARSCSITVPTAGLAGSVNVAAGVNSCPAGYSSPSGFGAISYTGLAIQPRNGQIVARFTF